MSQLAARLRVGFLQHFQEILGIGGVLLFALDLRRHLLQHRDQSSQAPFERCLARKIGLRRDLLFQLLRCDHALM